VRRFLDDLRSALKAGTFRALPVRERMIPKPGGSGKVKRLGIPHDRRPGGPGGAEAGAGTHLRDRLLAGLLRFAADAAGPRTDRQDPPARHPRLPVGARR